MSTPPIFLQRTREDFTTGIVNIPQDTPAILFVRVRSPEEKFKAQEIFEYYKAPYQTITKKKGDIVITKDVMQRDYIKTIKRNNPDLEIKTKNVYRYLFFELDTKDQQAINQVLSVYKLQKLPVYYHETMRGYHFLSIKPMIEGAYHFLLSSIKHLNMDCPHVTLRIKPNKWEGESEIFKRGYVWESPEIDDIAFNRHTRLLARWLEFQHIGLIKKNYFVVHYRMTGELGNL